MEMIQVEPGDTTGVYYIIVAGLPWRCSWKRLREFCQNQQADGKCLEVDYVHVDPEGSGTNGWVRVKGKQNFRKMMDHLKTVPMGDRFLIPFGRNEYQITSIKVPVTPEFGQQPRRNRNGSSSSTDTYPSSTSNSYYHQDNCSSPVYAGINGWCGQQQAGESDSLYQTSSSNSYHQSPLPIYDTGNAASSYTINSYFQPASQVTIVNADNALPLNPSYVLPITQYSNYNYSAPLAYAESHLPAPTSAPSIQSGAWKISLTSLPHTISQIELQQLLSKHIDRAIPRSSRSSLQDELLSLDIIAQPDKRPRLRAIAILKSESIARYLVRSLDRHRILGREMRAKLTKDGVESPGQYSNTAQPPSMFPLSDDHYPPFEMSQGTSITSQSRQQDIGYTPSETKALARENSGARRGKERSRDGDGDRKESLKKKSTSPVVVNGSSGGRVSRSKKDRSG